MGSKAIVGRIVHQSPGEAPTLVSQGHSKSNVARLPRFGQSHVKRVCHGDC